MKNLSPLHVESRVGWLAHTASACPQLTKPV